METNEIKERFRPGTVIRINRMVDDLPMAYHVPSGVTGTVTGVDDAGIVHMSWANGSTLGLLVNDDEYEILKEVA